MHKLEVNLGLTHKLRSDTMHHISVYTIIAKHASHTAKRARSTSMTVPLCILRSHTTYCTSRAISQVLLPNANFRHDALESEQ